MLEKLKKKPWTASLIAFTLYLSWFAVQIIWHRVKKSDVPTTPVPDVSEVSKMVSELPNQIGLVILLTGIVAVLVWWKQVGFRKHENKSLKFMIPPLVYIAVLFIYGMVLGQSGSAGFLGTNSSKELMLLILTTLLVGYTEETMFRGILFHGATARFKAVWGTIISSLIFGTMHFINMFGGQGFGMTVSQVVHAAGDGFMYAALRLMTGSLWPVMLLHGLWDLAVSGMHAAALASGGETAQALTNMQTGGVSISPIQFIGLFYGIFVLWRWVKRNK